MSPKPTSDPALLFRVAAGDRSALLALYDRHIPVLLALAQHIVGVGDDAEEVVQEVFLQIWRQAAIYRPQDGTVRAWLILRIRRQALDLLLDAPEILDQIRPARFALPPPEPLGGGSLPRRRSERRRAQRGLAQLSPQDRAFLEVVYFTGQSQPDIARRLQLSPVRLRSRLTTTLVKLRQALHTGRP